MQLTQSPDQGVPQTDVSLEQVLELATRADGNGNGNYVDVLRSLVRLNANQPQAIRFATGVKMIDLECNPANAYR